MVRGAAETTGKLRVLLIGPRGHGGEEVYVRTLVDGAPRGIEYIDAGTFHQGAPGARCRVIEEIALNRLVHPCLVPDIGFRSLTLSDHFDLVHVHAHPVRLHNLNETPLIMSEGSSSAVYLHDYLNWDDRALARGYSWTRRIYRGLRIHDRLLNLRRVSRAYVFSHWAREINIRWGADPSKLDVVYPGFPTPAVIETPASSTFTFLFVATDFERKGGFEVVEAFADVVSHHQDARLLMITADPWALNRDRAIHSWVPASRKVTLLKRLQEMESQGVVERQPLQTRPRLYNAIYPRADAFVMPSHAEGFGFTNVEALSFGLPVISSRIGAIPEAVEDGVTGLLVEPGSPQELAKAMRRLINDRYLARGMGQAGRATFLARFTMERFRSELGRVYQSALKT